MNMRKEFNVNMFKFDGVAGDPADLGEEMEAMLTLIDRIRVRNEDHALLQVEEDGTKLMLAEHEVKLQKRNEEQRQDEKTKDEKKKEKDPWINLTTGTWPSPFFLLWADSIWRGGKDVSQLSDEALRPLTDRQRWIVYREWK